MMLTAIADQLRQRLPISAHNFAKFWQRAWIVLAAVAFVLVATLIVAFDDIFVSLNTISTLQVGDVAPQDIVAPPADPFVSDILTQEERIRARESVQPRYDPPDPNIARQQTQLAQQILEFMTDVRRASFDTPEQKKQDLNQITALTLTDRTLDAILQLDDETWDSIEDEIGNVLLRVMRESIRPGQLQTVRDQLRNQVSVRFNARERDVIVAILEDLVRPNTFENPEATEAARQATEADVEPVRRSFVRGETIVNEGDRISVVDYEALQALGLLRGSEQRPQEVVQALLAVVLTLVIAGLYLARFQPYLLYHEPRMLALIATAFLLMLLGSRFLGIRGDIYTFPFAALALLYVAISGPQIAIISSLGLALLVGLMANNSLEVATLVAAGGIIGTLALRRAERLNTFFVAGLLIGLINAGLVSLFNITAPSFIAGENQVMEQVARAFLSGTLLVPAAAITVMYVVTILFNLPTTLKLLELSQPNKPLLQRLLREAPGTYQHSLMVGNLAGQATDAIGGDSQLVQVAALYHDIGKMNNPIYFAENQQNIANPHDTLNDPARSADIIISHVTEGDEMARQYRLPNRIRDFIREHHGTTQVFVFFRRAITQAGDDESAIDIEDFTYPGPRPRSRETAIMMLADSCESAVRANVPESRQAIEKIVKDIIDDKRDKGQLDDSGLTLGDLHIVQRVFVEILQGVFHPRVNYQQAIKPGASSEATRKAAPKPQAAAPAPTTNQNSAPAANPSTATNGAAKGKATPTTTEAAEAAKTKSPQPQEENDEAPLPDVPRLPSADERRITGNYAGVRNGSKAADDAEPTTQATQASNSADAKETAETTGGDHDGADHDSK